MAPKIDKKELEEPDKLQLFFLYVREFAEKNRISIFLITGVAVLSMLLAGGWYLYHLNYETSAGKVYAQIQESTMKAGPSSGDATAVKGYKELIDQYPRSEVAVTAYYKLGNLYLRLHQTDAAITAYENFLKKSPQDSDLVPLAYNGLGFCFEIKKDFKKALEYYENAMKTSTGSLFEALNYGSIARVYEAMNNYVKSVEYYRKALEKTTEPLMTLYLKRKISLLG